MPHRKSKGAKADVKSTGQPSQRPPTPSLPVASYISVVGVHATLLAFTAFFLPRTALPFLSDRPAADDARPSTLELLTAHPLRTVLWMCGGALVLQGWWAGWLRSWMLDAQAAAKGAKDAADTTRRKMERKELDDRRFLALGNALATTLVASVAFYSVVVLFGAPLASHAPETYALGLLLALLTVFTPAFTLGRPSLGSDSESLVVRMTWIRLFAELSTRTPVDRALVYPAVGAVLGCWSGVIPIGLDWERPWQAWPLTPAYGALTGYVLGSIAAAAVNGVKQLALVTAPSPHPPNSQKTAS